MFRSEANFDILIPSLLSCGITTNLGLKNSKASKQLNLFIIIKLILFFSNSF